MAFSAYRDRTAEFRSLTETLKRVGASPPQQNSYNLNGNPSTSPDLRFSSEFNKRASQLGLRVQDTDLKISRLAQVAKRSSMFDDPTVEINELTVVIKNDIAALNAALSDLQAIQKMEMINGTVSDDSVGHCNAVCDDLKGKLMALTKRLKELLTNRTENIKAHENRKQLFSSNAASRDSQSKKFMRQSNAINEPPPWSTSANLPYHSAEAAPLLQNNGQVGNQLRRRSAGEGGGYMEMAMMQEEAPRQSYVQSRAASLHNVESTISELSSMFTSIASMVVQQGELAIRIDDNMDETLANVENARSALLRHLNRISSNRWLLIKIFAVIVLFTMIFIVFVA